MAAELSGKQIVGRLVRRIVLGIVLAAVLVFSADYLILRVRVATNSNPYGTVTVRPYYAIPQKSKKTELDFEPPQDETCVNSMFPHMGYTPCWYRRTHTQEQLPDQ